MKKSIVISIYIFTFTTSVLFSQNIEKRDPGEFSEISVIGDIRIELYNSNEYYVEIESEGTATDNIITELDDGELSLRLRTKTPQDADTKIRVYFPELDIINVQARALITSIDTLRDDFIEFHARSGGKMELFLDLEHLKAEVKQGAILVFRGEVEKQEVEVTTGGAYSAYELEAKDTYIKAGSGSTAKVIARRVIDANANIKSYIGYKGNPVSSVVNTSLGGEVEHITE